MKTFMDKCGNCCTPLGEEGRVERIREREQKGPLLVPHLGEDAGEGNLELSVVSLQESQDLEASLGTHHFQVDVDVEEAQRLINSGVGIIMEEAVKGEKGFQLGEDGGSGGSCNFPREMGLSVVEALATVFGLPLLEEEGRLECWKKGDEVALCDKCGEVVTNLYWSYQDLRALSAEASYISKGVQRIAELLGAQEHVRKSGEEEPPEERKATTRRGRKPKGKRESGSGSENTKRKRVKEEPPEDENEFILGVGNNDVVSSDGESSSSDSNSLSDLEQDFVGTGNEADADHPMEVKRTRVSTRPRVVKKPPSDYEELESSEVEEEEERDDDEEEDPDFDAEEELQEIKVTQEYLRLRKLSDMCVDALEYKEADVEVDEEGRYICPELDCGKTFKGLKNLNKHVILHKLRKSPRCPKCEIELGSLVELFRHVKTVHGARGRRPPAGRPTRRSRRRNLSEEQSSRGRKLPKHLCKTCNVEFQSFSELTEHEAEHGPVTCQTCSKEFARPSLLARHEKDVHTKKDVEFSCPECGEIFKALEPLATHFRDHHNADLNFCERCGKSFLAFKFLVQHLRETHKLEVETIEEEEEHEDSLSAENSVIKVELVDNNPLMEPGERERKSDPTPYKCPHCDKEYRRKKQLDLHLLFHNGEEPQYSCTECAKSFFQKKSLKKHQLLHATNSPHVCTNCDKIFQRAEQLKRHNETVHCSDKEKSKKKKDSKEPVEHKCPDCDKTFTRKEYLRLHQRIHTGEKPYMCSDCGKTFRDPRNLAQHLVTHKTDRPFCCSICGLTFKRAHHLNDHEGTHKDNVARPFVCTLPNCGKAFKLKKHLISHELVHSGTKDHQCEICGKAFNRKDNLRQHVNKVHGKDSFSDLIRVPAEVTITSDQQVQIQLQSPNLGGPTLVPVTAITTGSEDGTSVTTIQISPQLLQALPFTTYTTL